MPRTTRRRLLTIMGAAAGMTLAPSLGRAATAPRWRWRGTALGAKAEIVLIHPDETVAKKLIRLATGEIERLEAIFSLHRADSELIRLNRHGRLKAPSHDMTILLASARQISELTEGAFDVTVQPLWHLYADHFARPDADPDGPSPAAIAAARRLVDYRAIDIEPSEIRLARPGMAITLNGIAQGYITDRVADLLRAHGIERTLIDLGEIHALGARPDGHPWQVAIDGREAEAPIDLVDRAIATSSPAGTAFDRTGRFHHLFDPASGQPSETATQVSVIAALADALSTALATMQASRRITYREKIPGILVL